MNMTLNLTKDYTNTHLIVQCHVDIHVISWSCKKRTAVQRQLLQTSRCLCRDAKLDIYYIPFSDDFSKKLVAGDYLT